MCVPTEHLCNLYQWAGLYTKVCTVKDRSGKDLIEAEEIKKRWKKYMREQH